VARFSALFSVNSKREENSPDFGFGIADFGFTKEKQKSKNAF
jgi:hypothetical protein